MEQLAAKVSVLESRLDEKKEQLLEKELVLEEVTTLTQKLRNRAGDGRGGCGKLDPRFFHQSQDGRGALRQDLAGGGGDHAASVPGEEGGAQFLFQKLDLSAQRRLGDMQTLGGLGQTAQFRDLEEGSKLFDIHKI